MNYILFYLVVLLANIIQGITGFAGTILAMPPSIMLVGYDVAKPVLNVLGIIAGLYVFLLQRAHVNWQEMKKVVLVMTPGIIAGTLIKSSLAAQQEILLKLLGVFVIVLALQGAYKALFIQNDKGESSPNQQNRLAPMLLLISAGVVHGMFVSGGPLLIGYLSKKIKDKSSFRATISTVWIILNTIILITDINNKLWNYQLIKVQLITIPFLFLGMFIGTILYKKMSQQVFMNITYLLLFISGILLLMR